MSPGTTRMRTKMSTATPSSVGIIRSSRLTTYFSMRAPPRLGGGECREGRRRGAEPPSDESFRQPHRVELVVQVMAGRDGPAADPGAVRDDPVPLERVEVVGLF